MLRGREAEATDQAALDWFVCSKGEPWAEDVQSYVGALLEWRNEGGPGRHVRLYEDDSGLVAVVAWRHLLEGTPGSGFFVYLLAVRADRRREKVARQIVNGLVRHLAQQEPGATLAWLVDPKNVPSCSMSATLAEDAPTSDPEWPHYLEYSATLPTSSQAVIELEDDGSELGD